MMAVLMGVGICASLVAMEPAATAGRDGRQVRRRRRLRNASAASPTRWSARSPSSSACYGWLALLMLAMISLYRLPEFVMGPMANPFYHDLGLVEGCRRRRARIDRARRVAARHCGGRPQRRPLRVLPDADHRADSAEPRRSPRSRCWPTTGPDLRVFGSRDGGRQLRRRLRRRRAGHLHVEPDQPRLHGDAVRASQLGIHVRRQVREGILGRDGRIAWPAAGRCSRATRLFFIGAGLLGIPALVLCVILVRVTRQHTASAQASGA